MQDKKVLIGLSGKIGVGKDTLARFLGEQIILGSPEYTTLDYRRFAGALKQVVSILTGCRVEQLEDREFKMKELPKCWERTMKEAREWLLLKHYSTSVLREICTTMDDQEIRSKATEHGFVFTRTYRDMLQEIGTEVFREHFHPLTWINATFAEWDRAVEAPSKVSKISGWGGPAGSLKVEHAQPKWIITDVRFPDEAAAIRERGGLLFRINRQPAEVISMQQAAHPSETSLDKYTGWDAIIDNNSTLEDLRNTANELVTRFNL
jgi:hypothetical protein